MRLFACGLSGILCGWQNERNVQTGYPVFSQPRTLPATIRNNG